MYFVNLW